MGDSLDRSTYTTVKPCKEPCIKCGGIDIHRVHYEKGQEVHRDYGKDKGKTTEFVARPSYDWKARKECIVHHCRCCHFEWDGPCLG